MKTKGIRVNLFFALGSLGCIIFLFASLYHFISSEQAEQNLNDRFIQDEAKIETCALRVKELSQKYEIVQKRLTDVVPLPQQNILQMPTEPLKVEFVRPMKPIPIRVIKQTGGKNGRTDGTKQ